VADRRPIFATDDALEAALRDLGSALVYPAPSGDLSAIVGERLRREPQRMGFVTRLLRERRARPRLALVLAAALLVLLAAVVAAAVIGLPGIRIVFVEGPIASPRASASSGASASPSVGPSPSVSARPTPLGGVLQLGEPIDPASLDAAAGRHVLRPTRVGPSTSAWLDSALGVPIVSLVWPASKSLPDTTAQVTGARSGIGAILTEIPVTIETDYLEKVVGSGGRVERVSVGSHPGFWITGAPHEIVLIGPNGEGIPSTTRLAGSSLLWEQDGLTLRLETGLDRAAAIALASSVR
jgi:hypothetical protein